MSAMTERRSECGTCLNLLDTARSNVLLRTSRLFLAALITGMSPAPAWPTPILACDMKNFDRPLLWTKSSGETGRPKNTSSFR